MGEEAAFGGPMLSGTGLSGSNQGRTQRCCCRGDTESQSLEPSVESQEGGMRGEMSPFSLGGSGGPPPVNFSKSMYLRTHFKPF